MVLVNEPSALTFELTQQEIISSKQNKKRDLRLTTHQFMDIPSRIEQV